LSDAEGRVEEDEACRDVGIFGMSIFTKASVSEVLSLDTQPFRRAEGESGTSLLRKNCVNTDVYVPY